MLKQCGDRARPSPSVDKLNRRGVEFPIGEIGNGKYPPTYLDRTPNGVIATIRFRFPLSIRRRRFSRGIKAGAPNDFHIMWVGDLAF